MLSGAFVFRNFRRARLALHVAAPHKPTVTRLRDPCDLFVVLSIAAKLLTRREILAGCLRFDLPPFLCKHSLWQAFPILCEVWHDGAVICLLLQIYEAVH